jgi:hypothetical protein
LEFFNALCAHEVIKSIFIVVVNMLGIKTFPDITAAVNGRRSIKYARLSHISAVQQLSSWKRLSVAFFSCQKLATNVLLHDAFVKGKG